MEEEEPKARLKCVQCGYEAEVKARDDLTVGKMIPGLCPDCEGNMIVVKDKDATQYLFPRDEILSIVRENVPIREIEEGYNHIRLEIGEPYAEDSFEKIVEKLEEMDFLPVIRSFGHRRIMTIFPKVEEGGARVRTNLILLGLTFLSTFAAGLFLTGFLSGATPWQVAKWDSIMYSVGIMSILGLHEMGHKLASMRFKVEATYPYFIPVPPPFILGTMGAVIKMKGSLPSRNAMMKIGSAGPICGFIVAIPVTLIGLALSTPEVAPGGAGGTSIVIGASVLFRLLRGLVVPDAYGLSLHPLAVAGWAGMLVTMLNLFPAGMLDGGHVSRAVSGKRIHKMLGYVTGLSLLGLFIFQWLSGASFAGWILWGILALFFTRVGHPGSLDESTRLNRTSVALAVSVLVIFVLTAIPLPIRVVDVPRVYISSFDASPVALPGPTQGFVVTARLANKARLEELEGVEARLLLPRGASLLSDSDPIVTVDSVEDSAKVTWNVTTNQIQGDAKAYCLVDSSNGGQDQAVLVLEMRS